MSEAGCRLCLLRDMDKSEYLESIRQRIDSLEEDVRTQAEEYERRLALCKKCSYLRDGFCGACGCFVELRAAVKVRDCPYEKWQQG